ncbi:splicing factor 3B subunit 4-like isoform X1 [Prionailurus viverrinus]|uniref:splicing factor 3B subunit 4-like isoform X1 n=1 Tax=Prionailurus viverrinus TaxID=61388 RepID=UPI001FF43FA9|nr:splicing factor 3B subunit 4-like isoform X1 [Prionailurus viverrinus]XP_047732981.1 splicing factor 3B subunit 4-like isoform X1 [Prionailurus viverrinus]XP_047732982.1 splicing factor 3B subunit 4-like isoform X1 [Prionailurus viverrinus]XP_047732983.1 splicing factor 3B subunit 4-like isoform X1 [Prionailurus viverrinus]XP_047732984.1 splicing factor 3B subunit 4-like isoform X1 [Prionailurus viverrinus]
MAVAAKPPALPTAARRSARPRPGRQLTGPGRGGAPVRPRPRPGPARLGRRAPLDTGHVPAGAARNLQPRWGEKGSAPGAPPHPPPPRTAPFCCVVCGSRGSAPALPSHRHSASPQQELAHLGANHYTQLMSSEA